MTTVLLVREGRTSAEELGVLAGWSPDVHLGETGRDDLAGLAARLAEVRFSAIVTSPLECCRETSAYIAAMRRQDLPINTEADLGDCRYGDWTGRPMDVLAKEPLWEAVLHRPSSVIFPGGEGLAAMQRRALGAVQDWNARLGQDSTYVIVSHGEVIRALLADVLGLHLDLFGRMEVDPASVSVVRYGPGGPKVARINDVGADLSRFSPPRGGRRP